jgi:hypothetical protein
MLPYITVLHPYDTQHVLLKPSKLPKIFDSGQTRAGIPTRYGSRLFLWSEDYV